MMDDFKIRICSDLDYEEMVADICFGNATVAIVNQEKGKDSMEIDILPCRNKDLHWKFSVDKFIESINDSKMMLVNMKKISE